jgi:hypothetical protein
MSGAAVLCDDLLVGVVTVDDPGFDSRRLVAVPVTAALADPEFAAVVARYLGTPPLVEPVELVRLSEPVLPPDSPAGLLRAEAATAPFRPRPELAELVQWCAGPEWSSIRLIVGAGGQGKTRLARQLAQQLALEGWATVLLAERASPDDISVIGDVTFPTLVVVDYAETRLHQIDVVLAELARAPAKVRLLLIARTAGGWRTELAETARLEVLARCPVIHLSPLEQTPAGRAEAWTQAADALMQGLAGLDGYRDIPWRDAIGRVSAPPIDGERHRTILSVQVSALAKLLSLAESLGTTAPDQPVQLPADPEDVLILHEERYWSRLASRYGISLGYEARWALVAAVTLWRPGDAAQARALIGAVLLDAGRDELTQAESWLAALYSDSERSWPGMQPDPLAEHFIGRTVPADGRCPALVSDTLAVVSPEQLEHGLAVLGRAHPDHPGLIGVIAHVATSAGHQGATAAIAVAPLLEQPEPLLAAVRTFAATAEGADVEVLAGSFPRTSVLLEPLRLTVMEQLASRLGDAPGQDREVRVPEPELVMASNDLAVLYAQAGRHAEAFSVSEQTVEHASRLVASEGDAYLPLLAKALDNHAHRLAHAGRRDESLAYAEDVVGLYRALVEVDRPTNLLDLAIALNTLAERLAAADRHDDATGPAREALELRQELIDLHREAPPGELAELLTTFAASHGEHAFPADDCTAAQEAVDLARDLVENGDRRAFLPYLASALDALAGRLDAAGRPTESLPAAEEMLALHRELAEFDRDAYLPALANALGSLALTLSECDRLPESVEAARESVELYEELVARDRTRYLHLLAVAQMYYAAVLDDAAHEDDAVSVARRAAAAYRELAADDPARFHSSVETAEGFIASAEKATTADRTRHLSPSEKAEVDRLVSEAVTRWSQRAQARTLIEQVFRTVFLDSTGTLVRRSGVVGTLGYVIADEPVKDLGGDLFHHVAAVRLDLPDDSPEQMRSFRLYTGDCPGAWFGTRWMSQKKGTIMWMWR